MIDNKPEDSKTEKFMSVIPLLGWKKGNLVPISKKKCNIGAAYISVPMRNLMLMHTNKGKFRLNYR